MPTIAAMAESVYNAAAVPNLQGPPPPPKEVTLSVVVSGVQAARNETVVVTGTNTYGESANSPHVSIYVPAGYVVVVSPPYKVEVHAPGGATGWNVYMTTGNVGSETKQNTSTLLLGNSFQEPSTGLIAGAALPNNTNPYPSLMDGNNNLADTPPSPGSIVVANTPQNTVNTNTGRSLSATQQYMAQLNALKL